MGAINIGFDDLCTWILHSNQNIIVVCLCTRSLHEKCPYLEFFWSVFYRIVKIRTRKTPNTDTFHAVGKVVLRIVAWTTLSYSPQYHCAKGVWILSFFWPHCLGFRLIFSPTKRKYKQEKNSEFEHISRSAYRILSFKRPGRLYIFLILGWASIGEGR